MAIVTFKCLVWSSWWFTIMMLLRTCLVSCTPLTKEPYRGVIVLCTYSDELRHLTCNVHMPWCCDVDVEHPQRCVILSVTLLSCCTTFFRLWELVGNLEINGGTSSKGIVGLLILLFLHLEIKLLISTDELSFMSFLTLMGRTMWIGRNGLAFWVWSGTNLWRNGIMRVLSLPGALQLHCCA